MGHSASLRKGASDKECGFFVGLQVDPGQSAGLSIQDSFLLFVLFWAETFCVALASLELTL